ncbi:uncharacterized protein METZ01_LOCUS244087, partial [marine metagenome]
TEARGELLLGAAFAGTAIEHSMLGAAHSAANPLTAHYDVIHGQAVGMLLPHVVRFNGEEDAIAKIYANLIEAGNVPSSNGADSPELLAEYLEALLDAAGLSRSLVSFGVEEAKLEMLSDEAASQWTASFNPRDITASDFFSLYQETLAA